MLKVVRQCHDSRRGEPVLLDQVESGWANYAQMAFATKKFSAVATALQCGAFTIPAVLKEKFLAFQRQYRLGEMPYLLMYDFPKTRPWFMVSNQGAKLPFFPDEVGGGWYHLLEDDVVWAAIHSRQCDTMVTASRQKSEYGERVWIVDIHLPIIDGELVKEACYHSFMDGREQA